MAVYLPEESAVYRLENPHWQRSIVVDLLRNVEYAVRVLVWQNGGGRAAHRPEVLDLPWDPPTEGSIQGDKMTLEEARSWLGWEVPPDGD